MHPPFPNEFPLPIAATNAWDLVRSTSARAGPWAAHSPLAGGTSTWHRRVGGRVDPRWTLGVGLDRKWGCVLGFMSIFCVMIKYIFLAFKYVRLGLIKF